MALLIPNVDQFQKPFDKRRLVVFEQHQVFESAEPVGHIHANAPTACEEHALVDGKGVGALSFGLETRDVIGSRRRQQVLQSLQLRRVARKQRLDGARDLVIVHKRDVITMRPVVRKADAGLELAGWCGVLLGSTPK